MNKWASAVWGFIDKKMKPIAFDGAIGFVRYARHELILMGASP